MPAALWLTAFACDPASTPCSPRVLLSSSSTSSSSSSSPLLAEPTQVLMEPGDAVFVMHATPQSGSHNSYVMPRCNIYFRLVHEKRMRDHKLKNKTVTGARPSFF
jgi:hypothetical protein